MSYEPSSDRNTRPERGAAAVEFALVVPLLIALVLGMVVFAHAYQVQSSLAMAAREGARVMALSPPDLTLAQAQSAAKMRASETALSLGISGVTTNDPVCSGTPVSSTTMVVEYKFDFLGVKLDLSGEGVMRCGG